MPRPRALVHLLLPGLHPFQGHRASLLKRVLAKSSKQKGKPALSAIAAASYIADFGHFPEHDYYCCDPVYYQADATQALIFSIPFTGFDNDEMSALVAAFNLHFAAQGLQLEYSEGGSHWYLRGLPSAASPEQIPQLDSVIGQNLQPLLLHQSLAGLNALLTEAQMLFFQHPVNQARERLGKLPANGVWIYGAGNLPAPSEINWDLIVTDSPMYKGLASYTDTDYMPIASIVDNWQCLNAKQNILVHTDSLSNARSAGPSHWQQQIDIIEHNYLKPLLSKLRRGVIKGLVVEDGTGRQHHIHRLRSLLL